jgi:hypothetical protein
METFIPPKGTHDLAVFWTWMGEDGICRTKAKPQAEITIKEALENSIAVNGFFKDKKFPLLVDSRNVKSMSRDARNYFSTNGRETKINSFAILVKSPLSRVIGNFFMGLNKPEVPAKLFDNEDKAVEWLKNFL